MKKLSAFFLNLKELKSEYNFAQLERRLLEFIQLFWWSSHNEKSLVFNNS